MCRFRLGPETEFCERSQLGLGEGEGAGEGKGKEKRR